MAKAFFLSIGAPAMISLAAKGEVASKQRVAATTGEEIGYFSVTLISSAYAQSNTPSGQAIQGRTIEVQLNGTMPEAEIAFVDASGNELKRTTIKLHQFESLFVPSAATSIVVRYGDSVADPYPLSSTPDRPQYVEITGTEGTKRFDLSTAFTGQGKILYRIQISEPSTAPLQTGQRGWVYMGVKSDGAWRTRYLGFAEINPALGVVLYAGADLTMRRSASKDAERIGRVKKNQGLKLLKFTNLSPGSQPNDADADGDYYAQVELQ